MTSTNSLEDAVSTDVDQSANGGSINIQMKIKSNINVQISVNQKTTTLSVSIPLQSGINNNSTLPQPLPISTSTSQPQTNTYQTIAPTTIAETPATSTMDTATTVALDTSTRAFLAQRQTIAPTTTAATPTTSTINTATTAALDTSTRAFLARRQKRQLRRQPIADSREKCRRFLANLLELSSREPRQVERSVRTLIQKLIDAKIEPEEFCVSLESLLNVPRSPYLLEFLEKNLPPLRRLLYARKFVIKGIRSPPIDVLKLI